MRIETRSADLNLLNCSLGLSSFAIFARLGKLQAGKSTETKVSFIVERLE
jgi:hypothetical protein